MIAKISMCMRSLSRENVAGQVLAPVTIRGVDLVRARGTRSLEMNREFRDKVLFLNHYRSSLCCKEWGYKFRCGCS